MSQLTVKRLELSDEIPEIVVQRYKNGVLTNHESVCAMKHVRQLYQSLKMSSNCLN